MTTDQLLRLRVAAARSGTAPATWGQQAIWDAVAVLGADAPRYNVALPLPVEPGRPLPALLDDLTGLLLLHDSLRTRLLPDDSGRLCQHLDGEGELPVVLRHGDRADADALFAELLGQPFDTARRWPLRIGLVEEDGLVRHLVIVLSHTATDGWGVRRLHQDLIDLAAGLTVDRIRALRPALRPADEAVLQHSPRGRRRDEAARRYWCERLASGPRRLFEPDAAAAAPDRLLPNARLHSPALAGAVALVAAGRGVSSSSVLLAAAAAQQARLSGSPQALLQVVVNNRFRPAAAQAVSTMAQEGLFQLSHADGPFSEVLGRARTAALTAYRHAAYDKRLLDRDIARLGAEQGRVADISCTFNDARITRADALPATDDPGSGAVTLDRLRQRTRLSWPVEFPQRGPAFTFAMDVVLTPDALELAMTADAALLPRAGMESFLFGIEESVVAEARALGHE
ncbi:condensation domain-containing protein [Streptacidiphilus jiangxiensis]|uniref:Condensation domain-containing protein n=1 Tax=Streptacidiphilus jiangxiensis TaxID=235985 RepID=A0A1H7JIV4_STRJI|nr:condensation domain-containing protein [Streptacidiphilus jiangxiensis]SEK74374.1 Condensation domain-containing protein [Streptacidiphilus jiangxiensis]